MSRSKAPPRIKGPYSERGGTRFRIRICDAAGRRDLYFSTRKEALIAIKEAARALPASAKGRTLGKVLKAYMEDKVQQGSCSAHTAEEQRTRMLGWLGDSLEDDLGKLTAKRAAALYEQLVQTPTSKTGQPPTAATQRHYLKLAKAMFRWAVKKGYLSESPFASIQPVGRPNRGKKQLRFDEAERFITTAFQLFDERQDTMALAAVTALLLGCRASAPIQIRQESFSAVWGSSLASYCPLSAPKFSLAWLSTASGSSSPASAESKAPRQGQEHQPAFCATPADSHP